MSIGKKLLLLALAAPFVVAEAPTVQAAPARKPPLCTAGRFAVSGAPLLGPGGEVVVLENKTLAIGTLCPAAAREAARQKKGTSVRITFPKGGCTGVSAKVRIKALITDDCSAVDRNAQGPKGRQPVEFTAATSVCGDGVVDPGSGEAVRRQRDRLRDRRGLQRRLPVRSRSRADKSSPIEITADGAKVVAANTDTDTASFFEVGDDGLLTKLAGGGAWARSRARSRPW